MDNGLCFHHGGRNHSGGAPEGNNNAVTVEAYSQSFVEEFLRDDEIERVQQFRELTETPEGARATAKLAAGVALEQFRRTGDPRLLRRYESICDTFGIAPADELAVDMDADHSFDAAEGVTAEFVTYEVDDDDDK
jgi:hypothetical protein